jgi:hypothetical protein
VYDFTRDDSEIETMRTRIAAMSDELLLDYGKAAADMAKRSTRETFRVQRDEARAEWRRRKKVKENARALDSSAS